MRILQHFFPDHELNLQSLRAISKGIRDGSFSAPPIQQIDQFFTQPSSEDGESPQDFDAPDEFVEDLHEPLGCMMKDSRGRFRYVGAHSEIPFNAAVVTLGTARRNPAIIPPPKLGSYPPTLAAAPSPSTYPELEEAFNLPARHLCDLYVARFLEDVHCTHWLYSVEDLLHRVDDTYSESAPSSSSSWMCSLYAIFAIGAANYDGANGKSPSPHSPAASDRKNSEDYIALAKQLIPTVYDEADVDSIRALAIMVSASYPQQSVANAT
jgi:hypothetical protein